MSPSVILIQKKKIAGGGNKEDTNVSYFTLPNLLLSRALCSQQLSKLSAFLWQKPFLPTIHFLVFHFGL